MKKIKINKNKVEYVLIIIILIILAVIVGINRIKTSDFNPINGDFQNYNPVRRFLDGQIPFKDFAVYLGTGQLMVLSIILLIIGNNFTASLFASNMITMLFFELTVVMISYFILKDKKKALYVALFMSLINIIRPQIINILNSEFIQALSFGISPQNSARLIRMAISPIMVLLIYISLKFIDKSKNEFIIKHKDIIKKIIFPIFSGLTILWSNDGGIATYISISFIYFILLIKQYKKDIKQIIKYTFFYIGISVITFMLALCVITRGNVINWFKFNFGVSSYQKWYYESAPGKTNYSLIDMDMGLFNIIMILISIYYIYKIFKTEDKHTIISYAMLDIMILASIISAYIYQIGSGGMSKDMLNLILLIIIVSYIFKILQEINKKQILNHIFKVGIFIISFATVFSNFGSELKNVKNRNTSLVYIEELGGYFSKYGNSIKLAMERIGNEKVFSTYATVDRDFNTYRYWVKNSNWFFYRELYKDYKPVFATEYNVFFEKNNNKVIDKNEAKIELKKQNDTKYTITVTTNDPKFNGMVDVKLSYKSEFTKSFFKTLDISKYVYVEDITGSEADNNKNINYNIPSNSDEYYIPITVLNGKGTVNITSYPIKDTKLNIKSAEIMNIYDVMFKYCVASENKAASENVIYINNTEENKVILDGVKAIKINDIEEQIINKDYTSDNKFIELQLEKNVNVKNFAYPNFFEVIK